MADGNKNEVRIRVVLDSEEAKQRLEELQRQLDSVYGGNGGANGGGRSVGSQGGTLSNAQAQINQQPRGVGSDAANGGDKGRNETEEERGRRFGRGVEERLNKVADVWQVAITKVFSKIASDFTELGYIENVHAGMNTYPLQRQRAAESGTLQGALWGGSIGMMMGGPIGAVVGGVGGAAYQSWMNTRTTDEQQRLKSENEILSMSMGLWGRERGVGRSQGSMAFNAMLGMSGDRDVRLDMLEKQIKMVGAEGDGSVDALRAKVANLASGNLEWQQAQEVLNDKSGKYSWNEKLDAKMGWGKFAGMEAPDTESEEFQKTKQELSAQEGVLSQLQMQKFQEEFLKDKVNPWVGQDFSDSFSRRGLYAGAQVDMEKANQPIVNLLTRIIEKLEPIANQMFNGFNGAGTAVRPQRYLVAAPGI